MQQSQKGFSSLLPSSFNLSVQIPPLPLFNLQTHQEDAPMAPRHSESKRCCAEGCKKKLMLSDFPCKCGKKHCSTHRAPEVHACTFDFKACHRNVLLQTMSSSVIAKKIDVL
jgi:hypothetical protein